MSCAFCALGEAGAGHTLAQATLRHEGFFQLTKLLVKQVIGQLDQANHHIRGDGWVGVFDTLLEGLEIGVGLSVQLAETPGVRLAIIWMPSILAARW